LVKTTKGSGIPGSIDQGIWLQHVEVLDLEDMPMSPRRAICLKIGVDGGAQEAVEEDSKAQVK
jgi:hypothetical protein